MRFLIFEIVLYFCHDLLRYLSSQFTDQIDCDSISWRNYCHLCQTNSHASTLNSIWRLSQCCEGQQWQFCSWSELAFDEDRQLLELFKIKIALVNTITDDYGKLCNKTRNGACKTVSLGQSPPDDVLGRLLLTNPFLGFL